MTSFPTKDDQRFIAALQVLKDAGCDVSITSMEGPGLTPGGGIRRTANVAWTTHSTNGRLLT